jgi:hypothetical protein
MDPLFRRQFPSVLFHFSRFVGGARKKNTDPTHFESKHREEGGGDEMSCPISGQIAEQIIFLLKGLAPSRAEQVVSHEHPEALQKARILQMPIR